MSDTNQETATSETAADHHTSSSRTSSSASKSILFTGVTAYKDMKEGMWILVKLTNLKSVKFYIAKVEKIYRQQQECDVTYLKQYRSTTNQFVKPDVEQTFVIGFSDVVGKLLEPQQMRCGILQFGVDIREWRA